MHVCGTMFQKYVCNHVACASVWLGCIPHSPLDFSCIYNAAHMHPDTFTAGGRKALFPLFTHYCWCNSNTTGHCGSTYKIYRCMCGIKKDGVALLLESKTSIFHIITKRGERRFTNTPLWQFLPLDSFFPINKSWAHSGCLQITYWQELVIQTVQRCHRMTAASGENKCKQDAHYPPSNQSAEQQHILTKLAEES